MKVYKYLAKLHPNVTVKKNIDILEKKVQNGMEL
jgi:hypothetical protein